MSHTAPPEAQRQSIPTPDTVRATVMDIVQMLPDVLFRCEKDGDDIIWILNEGKLAHEFGLTTNHVHGKRLEQLFPPDVTARLRPHFERCFAGEAHEFVNELGGRYFKHFPQPVLDANGKVHAVVGFISEVTSLVQAEERIRGLNAQLEAQVALLERANEQLEAFNFSVSHDLRSPLTAMGMTLLRLRKHVPAGQDAATSRSLIEKLETCVTRMNDMIEDILHLARAAAGHLERVHVDVSSLVKEVTDALRLVEPDRKVELTCEAGVSVQADERLTRLLLENLLGNAWKYTRGRAVGTIRVGYDTSADAITVSDNGDGFPQERATDIFRPFHRAHGHDAVPGYGVGLSTARRIVEAHGGKIWARGRPGVGAEFFFCLAPKVGANEVPPPSAGLPQT